MEPVDRYSSSWRDIRNGHRSKSGRFLVQKVPLLLASIACIAAGITGALLIKERLNREGHHPGPGTGSIEAFDEQALRRGEVSKLMAKLPMNGGWPPDPLVVDKEGVRYHLRLSIDRKLQGYIERLLGRSRTEKAAVVAINPIDGRVLAMAGHAPRERGVELCTRDLFPAASLFKLVSAAAALEEAGFTPQRTVSYRGRRHTLYKSQLEPGTGYTAETSFGEAFAFSINPVFGKLGIYDLGRDVISRYAERFLFNRSIPFDLPVAESTYRIPTGEFGLAEIASGFNKETRISPLHGALLAAAAANDGVVMKPSLVDSVADASEKTLYRARPALLVSPISRGTAGYLRNLMQMTVRKGTCRRSLGRLLRKKEFRGIAFGAKTGTINDRTDRYKYDWLMAYAIPGERTRMPICLAIVGVHGKILGVRANELGRAILRFYYGS